MIKDIVKDRSYSRAQAEDFLMQTEKYNPPVQLLKLSDLPKHIQTALDIADRSGGIANWLHCNSDDREASYFTVPSPIAIDCEKVWKFNLPYRNTLRFMAAFQMSGVPAKVDLNDEDIIYVRQTVDGDTLLDDFRILNAIRIADDELFHEEYLYAVAMALDPNDMAITLSTYLASRGLEITGAEVTALHLNFGYALRISTVNLDPVDESVPTLIELEFLIENGRVKKMHIKSLLQSGLPVPMETIIIPDTDSNPIQSLMKHVPAPQFRG